MADSSQQILTNPFEKFEANFDVKHSLLKTL